MKTPFKIIVLLLFVSLVQLSCNTKQKPESLQKLEENTSLEVEETTINKIKSEEEITNDTVIKITKKVIENAQAIEETSTEDSPKIEGLAAEETKRVEENVVKSIESEKEIISEVTSEITKKLVVKEKIRKVITPSEFKEKSLNHTILDIRTPFEYKRGYIKGSENINYYDRNFLEQLSKFDKNEPIYVYCRSGSRTSSASKKLSKMGFIEIYDLQGGILNWERNKNPIEK